MHKQFHPVPFDPPASPEEFWQQLASLTEEAHRPKRPWSPMRRGRRTFIAAALLGFTGLSVAGAVVASTCTLCYAVSSDGVPVAYVQGKETYQQAVRQVESQVSEVLQTDYVYPEAKVALTLAPKERLEDPEQLTSSLMDTVDQVKEKYVLAVDGIPVGACDSREAIDQALWQVKADYTTGNTVAVYFDSAVEISQTYLPAQTEVLDATAMKDRLTQGTSQATEDLSPALSAPSSPEEAVHPEEEDAAAAVFAPMESELTDSSADIPLSPEVAPPLQVQTVEEVTYTLPIPAPVEEVEDSSLLLGQRKTIQEGIPGLEERTDRVTCRCGEEEARETVSSTVLLKAVPTRVAVGTAQGVEGAQGRFIWPCMGRISSPFGARHIFGKDSFHTGTDIAQSLGTDIVAAADGQVIWSGVKGSYGNLVKVDHGNGFLTYYAHCSQLLVQEGDTVTQGQVIAKVGSTGRSTGPHCHFEIRWQQEPIDPQLCLS